MRVLFLADPFLPVPPTHYGGIERVIASVIRGAQAHGHEVALLAHADSRLPGAPVYPLTGGASPTWYDHFRNILRVRRAVADFQPDLIHSFARLAYLAPVLLSRTPKIMAYNREPTPRTVRWAARLAGGSLTFVGCSDSITARGSAHGGRWVSIHNGVDLERYDFQARVAADAPLVFLSRMDRIKGAHHAITAARLAGRDLILAGNRTASGPERACWDEEIAPHLGRAGISYIGPVDDAQKNRLLGGAAALLVPIEWEEPFGMVFIEALACGTPVISFRRGALPEIVEDGREGFLCERPEELPDLIQKISTIHRADCRQKVHKKFSSRRMSDRHEILYKSLDGVKVHVANHVREASEG